MAGIHNVTISMFNTFNDFVTFDAFETIKVFSRRKTLWLILYWFLSLFLAFFFLTDDWIDFHEVFRYI